MLLVAVFHDQRVGAFHQPVAGFRYGFGSVLAQEIGNHRREHEIFVLFIGQDERAVSKILECGLSGGLPDTCEFGYKLHFNLLGEVSKCS